MTPRSRSFLSPLPWIKLPILAAILIWIVQTFPRDNWDTLLSQDKHWGLLLSALAILLAAHGITFWRWWTLLRALDVPLRLLDAIRLGFLGTMLNLVSVGAVGGDIFKAVAAARLTHRRRTEVVASVLVDRAIGLLGLVLVASISLSWIRDLSENLRWIWLGATVLGGLGVLSLAAVVTFGHRLPLDWLRRIPWVGSSLYRMAQACVVFQGRPGTAVQMLVATLGVHTLVTLSCWLISSALYADPPTIAQHFQAIPPAVAAATLPLTPGGIGVQEVAIDALFREVQGMPDDFSGLIVAAMLRVLLIAIAMIGAVVYFTGGERKFAEAGA